MSQIMFEHFSVQRTGGVRATFGPTIFSRNNYMSVTRSIWTTNLA